MFVKARGKHGDGSFVSTNPPTKKNQGEELC